MKNLLLADELQRKFISNGGPPFPPHTQFYSMNDEMTGIITRASSQTSPAECLAMLIRARPPSPVTWIEFSLHEKVRVTHQITSFNQVPARMGFLIVEHPFDRFSIDIFVSPSNTSMLKSKSYMMMFRVWISTGEPFGILRHEEEEDGFMGDNVDKLFGFKILNDGATDFGTRCRVQVLLDPPGDQIADAKRCFLAGLDFEMNENTGIMRWLTVLLSMLGRSETHHIPIEGRPARTFVKSKFYDRPKFTELSIRLPNNKTVVEYVGDLVKPPHEPVQKINHPVRGYWRHVSGTGNNPECKHASIKPIHAKRNICPECGFQETLVAAHRRGSIDIGVKETRYLLKA